MFRSESVRCARIHLHGRRGREFKSQQRAPQGPVRERLHVLETVQALLVPDLTYSRAALHDLLQDAGVRHVAARDRALETLEGQGAIRCLGGRGLQARYRVMG